MMAASRRTGSRTSAGGSRRGHSGRSSSAARRSGSSSGSGRSSRRRNPSGRLQVRQQLIDWLGDVFKVVLVVIVLLYCISMSGKAYEIGYSIFYEEAVDEEGSGVEIEVTITETMTVAQIGELLEEAGLLLNADVFVYQELLSSSHGQIVAGTYTLSTDMTPSDIISALAENYVEPADSE